LKMNKYILGRLKFGHDESFVHEKMEKRIVSILSKRNKIES